MADIKTRDAVKGTIKTLDKAAIAGERMKSAYAKTKDKAEQGYYAEENSPTEYAADKVSHASGRIRDEGVHQFNNQGQKSVAATRENVGKAKDKLADFKAKRAAKAAEQKKAQAFAEQNGSLIRNGTASRSPVSDVPVKPEAHQTAANSLIKTRQQGKKTIKTTVRNAEKTVKTTARGTVKATEKGVKTAQATSKAAIKTTEQTAKTAQKAAKASAKATQRRHRRRKQLQRRQPKQRKQRSGLPLPQSKRLSQAQRL